MKFSSTVDSLAKEIFHLRILVQILGIAVLILGIAVLFLHDKTPLLVERSSRGMEIVHASPLRRTDRDIGEAIRLLLNSRFNTDTISPELFLSARQLELRSAEQQEMKARNLTQIVFVRSSRLSKGDAIVELDRVLAVGDVRSTIRAVVKIAFEEITPNELNPYGLRLALADAIEKPEEKK